MVKKILEELIKTGIKKAGYTVPVTLNIEESKNIDWGDYSTQAVFKLKGVKDAKKASKEIVKYTPKQEIIKDIDSSGGFINIFLTEDFLKYNVKEIISLKEKFGQNESGEGKKAQVEFISANPTGPLHLGNARGGPLGDVLANVLEMASYKVEREYYVNDIGRQVINFGQTIRYWQEVQRGKNPEFPQDGYKGKYVEELARRIKGNPDVGKLAKAGVDETLKGIKETNKKIGIDFDQYVFESEMVTKGKTNQAIEKLKYSGKTQDKDGALWFVGKGKKFINDRECVLRRSDEEKTPTYFANDIAYHQGKYERKYDLMVDVWGANHHGHIERIKGVLEELNLDSSKLKIILYQYVRLKHGQEIERMAKREGTYITADQVLDEVGKDVFRMMMLLSAPNTHLDFDFELAKKRSKQNPVFYVQYAHARICGILRKSQALSQEPRTLNFNKYELALAKELIKFPDLVYEISQNFEVHHLPHYAISLAKTFHQFYKNCPVLKAKKGKEKDTRIYLIKATQIVLKNTLNLMGIDTPERM